MIKAALYPRVSTAEQAKEGYSIGEQTERLKSYCAAMGWTVYNTYTDAGYSGGNTDRPGLQALIRDVEDGKIDKVVVYKLDRLSRSQKDALHLIEDVFIPHNVDFVSITENFDTSTAFGKAAIGMTACFAQLEKENIRQRMEMGRLARAKQGLYSGARKTPFGYDYIDGHLIVNEEQAAIVREIFKMYNAGCSPREIEKHCLGMIATHQITRTMIRYILKNKVYAGFVSYGKETFPGVHEPIISIDNFEIAQKRISEMQQRYEWTNIQTNGDTHTTLLGGMIYCKRCGARYGKSYSGAVNRRHTVYECYSRSKDNLHLVRDPACKNTIYRTEDLDNIVLDEIRKIKISPTTVTEEKTNRASKADIWRKIKQTDGKIARLLDLYAVGNMPLDQLDDKVQQLTAQRDELQNQLSSIPSKITPEQAQITISSLDDVLKIGDRDDLRKIIEILIDRIDIDGDDVYIQWRL